MYNPVLSTFTVTSPFPEIFHHGEQKLRICGTVTIPAYPWAPHHLYSTSWLSKVPILDTLNGIIEYLSFYHLAYLQWSTHQNFIHFQGRIITLCIDHILLTHSSVAGFLDCSFLSTLGSIPLCRYSTVRLHVHLDIWISSHFWLLWIKSWTYAFASPGHIGVQWLDHVVGKN